MRNIDKVKKAQRDVEMLQSALTSVHAGLDTVGTMVETADEVRRGFRQIVKLGLVLAVVGVAVAIVLKVRRSGDPEPSSTEPASD
jgi:hypothetical protein